MRKKPLSIEHPIGHPLEVAREELLGELGILRHGTRHGLLEELAGGRQSETAAREL
jgi:hypothetical protein